MTDVGGNEGRTQGVGADTLQSAASQPTSLGKKALYAACEPNQWGMRYSDKDTARPGWLVYPVVNQYVDAIYDALLNRVQWGKDYWGTKEAQVTVQWPINSDQAKSIFQLIMPVIAKAAMDNSDNFGIPEGAVPKSMVFYDTEVISQSSENQLAVFDSLKWTVNFNIELLKNAFDIGQPASKISAMVTLKRFANIVYHEIRHCQQFFWVYAIVQQYPGNFKTSDKSRTPGITLPNIAKWPSTIADKVSAEAQIRKSRVPSQLPGVVKLAANQSIPADDSISLAGIMQMAISIYLYELNYWKNHSSIPFYLGSTAAVNDEYSRARMVAIDMLENAGIGGTPIRIDAMIAEQPKCRVGYSSRPWENDALFCGDMVDAYWDAKQSGKPPETYPADWCSRDYEFDSQHSNQSNGE